MFKPILMYTSKFALLENSLSTGLRMLVLELLIVLSSYKLTLDINSNTPLDFLCYFFRCCRYKLMYASDCFRLYPGMYRRHFICPGYYRLQGAFYVTVKFQSDCSAKTLLIFKSCFQVSLRYIRKSNAMKLNTYISWWVAICGVG